MSLRCDHCDEIALEPCPKCAEKDQELDASGKVLEKLQSERDGLRDKCAEKDAEIAWLKSERPAIAKAERDLRDMITKQSTELGLVMKERDELKASLEKAKEALKEIRDALCGSEMLAHVSARDCLKEIA